jgi:hypothetical protein
MGGGGKYSKLTFTICIPRPMYEKSQGSAAHHIVNSNQENLVVVKHDLEVVTKKYVVVVPGRGRKYFGGREFL